ncbi:MAG TPA: DUF6048 family protein [Amoebophilaceae bacterium]|jgi:hypothetical protein|nr:DUF6048 family protein [Amoebophilaceae bacterium]
MLRSIINFLFFIILSPFFAWGNIEKSKKKMNPYALVPTTLYVGMDVAKTGYGWYQKTGNAYEFHGSIDTSRIVWNLDYGFGKIERNALKQKGSYAHTNGHYLRIGAGYTFLSPTLQHNVFFIGLYYAKSNFDFHIKSNKLTCNHTPEKPCLPLCEAPDSLKDLQGNGAANWWELVAGTKVQFVSIVSIGCTARYRFAQKLKDRKEVLPFDLLGWGLREDAYAFGYNAYLLVRVPLQKNKLK